jgi:tetratricopeptide (TPR) repeat protein
LTVNRKDDCLRELEKILKNDSQNIESLILKGKVHLFMGNYIESGKHFWRVNQINPNHSEIQQYVSIMKIKMDECLQKANSYIIKNKLRMGILWCGTALSIYPNHPEALLIRSAINRKLGNFEESIKDLNLASQYMTVDGKYIKL